MESILDQVRSLADEADDVGKRSIIEGLRQLQIQLETPMDLFMKMYNSHIQIAVVYVAIQLGLFQHLAKDPSSSVTVAQLAEESGASPELLRALLRYLASVALMSNPSPDHYQATRFTHFLATPLAEAGLLHAFETCGPATSAFPAFLAENSYTDITSNTKTPFQKGHKTDVGAFQWLTQHPQNFGALQTVMTALQSADWLNTLDFLNQAASEVVQASETPFFVDVGGGHGHQCKQLLEKHPGLRGSIVLQDLPQAIDKLPPIEGIQVMVQNFFDRQSILGAKYYYLRRIMHDWPDAECHTILSELCQAMGPDSRVLLDEVVLPDENTPWYAAMQDISMKILFAGKERTRSEWSGLIQSSGLNLIDIRTYDLSSCASVIVLEKK